MLPCPGCTVLSKAEGSASSMLCCKSCKLIAIVSFCNDPNKLCLVKPILEYFKI